MTVFHNKKILVTGGTGSLGKELVRYLLANEHPEIVRIFDVDETEQFEFQQELKGHEDIVRFLLGDVRDKERLSRAVENIDIIFHTAALKHVMACEYNPFEAVKTNVIGMQNIIDVSIDNNVSKVIFTSSDKAVNPSNTMGATKLLAEKLMTSANYYKGARECVFSSVRFGNVMGSRGSVIPLFKQQIKAGGPVTITDPTMTRFMMSMSQAVELVLLSVGMSHGGEVFIFKMPTVNIQDLAEVLIEELAHKYGYRPEDIDIEIIGSKPGEKMYEELMTEDEASRSLEREDMFIIIPEIKDELLLFDESAYGATSIISQDYVSKNAVRISKDGIRTILKKDKII
ncbi:UDP-N-acetylglucosamine 4,6-dehydratase family protein [Methanolobus sp.]|jgi:UDP-N-acetylglucosamine 4,6-dehydratase|uniref:UDP-N-acetylglucosamine 4,6-dehydratase family protein n=1 Tax=Methanolobus sp. TaxID=1874737 RepID=UPI0025EEF304|nr:UDP-N-acetylglucosamine 4,6-dehydratase family protein [Methanolobus sp.]